MAEPIAAQKEPYAVEVKAGRRYFWCACGRSAKQPFCDGSHAGTGLEPLQYKAEKDRKAKDKEAKEAALAAEAATTAAKVAAPTISQDELRTALAALLAGPE